MSNLESIVPPVAMCKRIPAGEFEDSALVWEKSEKYFQATEIIDYEYKVVARDESKGGFPAPTLEEILNALYKQDRYENKLKICPVFPGGEWSIGYSYQKVEKDFDLTAAALRLWFEVKGIEVE